jgi:hypothetical protein
VLWNTLLFGILSGAALSAIAYYRIVADDNGAVIVFGAVAILSWIAAGFLAARATMRTLAGALAGFFSGVLGALLGLIAHQSILQQSGDAWYQLVSHCVQANPQEVCIDKPTFLSNEASLTTVLVIVWPLVALILGLIAGFVGSTSARRDTLGDEYQGGAITLHPSLIPSHRTSRAQGQDRPQTDRPTF